MKARAQRHISALVAGVIALSAALLAGCGASSDLPPPQEETEPSPFWTSIGLPEIDEEHIITVIVPGRKCWSASVESRASHLGACGTFRYRLVNEDVGTVKAVKQTGGRYPLTLIVEYEGEEKGRATTTEPHGTVEVEG
jgi:hypothetical protein